MNTPHSSYQERITRVLLHIESQVDDPPGLEELARIACISPFHFHRIFKAMTGESVEAYVGRLQLERAAQQLSYSRRTVTDIALNTGYDSVDAFTRAFRSWFGALPSHSLQAVFDTPPPPPRIDSTKMRRGSPEKHAAGRVLLPS